jgi:hypothetical protein
MIRRLAAMAEFAGMWWEWNPPGWEPYLVMHASARRWNVKPSRTAYVRWSKGPQQPLRFTKSGDLYLERIWATRDVGTRLQAAEVNATASSPIDMHGQIWPTDSRPYAPQCTSCRMECVDDVLGGSFRLVMFDGLSS